MKRSDMKYVIATVLAIGLSATPYAQESYVANCSDPALKGGSCYQECWCTEANLSGQRFAFNNPPDAAGQCRNVPSHQGEAHTMCSNTKPTINTAKPGGMVGLLLLQQLSQTQLFR